MIGEDAARKLVKDILPEGTLIRVKVEPTQSGPEAFRVSLRTRVFHRHLSYVSEGSGDLGPLIQRAAHGLRRLIAKNRQRQWLIPRRKRFAVAFT